MTTSARSRLTYEHDTVSSADGVTTFNITATFHREGDDLPDGVYGVFLKRAVVPSDPKADEFVRVAQLGDLGSAATSREIATDPNSYRPAAGALIRAQTLAPGYYLTATITLAFDNLAVAIRAKKIMEQRVDSLISSWKAYRDSFHAVTSVPFPLYDDGLVQKAKDAYYAAEAALQSSEADKARADAAVSAANGELESVIAEKTRLTPVKANVCGPVSALGVFSYRYDEYFSASGGRRALLTAIESALSNDNTPSGVKSVLEAALSEEGADYAQLAAVYELNFSEPRSQINVACSTLSGQLNTLQQSEASLGATIARAKTAAASASQAVKEKQAAKNAALVGVLAVCPSFVPS